MPTISVIVPVFNGAAFLAECLDSVLASTLEDFELLVGDDGSSDASRAILGRYDDPRVRIFLNEQNVGLFANLNLLTARSSTPLLRFLCQDDAIEPECLAFEAAWFDANANVVMSICSVHEIDSTGKVTGAWGINPAPSSFDSNWYLQRLFYEGCVAGSLSTVCVRVSALKSAGPFDETFDVAGDYEMWVRLCRQGLVTDLHTRLIRQRVHGARLSAAPFSGVRFIREGYRVMEKLIPLLPAAIQPGTRRYARWRQDVFNANHFVHCLLSGRLAQCRELIGIMGIRHLVPGLAAWLVTVNNRLYKPKPVFYREPD